MKRQLSIAIVLTDLALPSLALAQGTRTTKPGGKKDSSFNVTRTVMGKVVTIKEGKSLVVESDGKRHEFKLVAETKAPSGLKKSDHVKVTYRASDNTATEVQKSNSTS